MKLAILLCTVSLFAGSRAIGVFPTETSTDAASTSVIDASRASAASLIEASDAAVESPHGILDCGAGSAGASDSVCASGVGPTPSRTHAAS